MSEGINPMRAARLAVKKLERTTGGPAGVICINRKGKIGYGYNTKHLPVGYIDASGNRNVSLQPK